VKPWRASVEHFAQFRPPDEVVSRKLYSEASTLCCLNCTLFASTSARSGFGTFHQWSDLGCIVKKRPADIEAGHWGCSVVLWKPFTRRWCSRTVRRRNTKFYVMKYFTVFKRGSGRSVKPPRSFRP